MEGKRAIVGSGDAVTGTESQSLQYNTIVDNRLSERLSFALSTQANENWLTFFANFVAFIPLFLLADCCCFISSTVRPLRLFSNKIQTITHSLRVKR